MGDIMNTGGIHEYNEFLGALKRSTRWWQSLTSDGSRS